MIDFLEHLPKIKEISLVITSLVSIFFGYDKWKMRKVKTEVKGAEIDNVGKAIDNRKKNLEIDKVQIESLIQTINQLKEDNEGINKRLNNALKEAEEIYKKYDDCRDAKLKIEDENAQLLLDYNNLKRNCK